MQPSEYNQLTRPEADAIHQRIIDLEVAKRKSETEERVEMLKVLIKAIVQSGRRM